MAIDCLNQDFQDYQDFQDGGAQVHGVKVCKTLMSIDAASGAPSKGP